jgi:Spy/CpxP family protein refolding chaperone
MNRLSCWVLGLGLNLLLTAVAGADEERKRPEPSSPPFPLLARQPPLLTPGMLEKLKLTDDQKEKVNKLLKDFETKHKETETKFREATAKAGQDPEAARKLGELARSFQELAPKQHAEAESKLKELLTKEQQKKYEELKRELILFPGPHPLYFPPVSFRPFPGHILPVPLQETLSLSPEQKAKIAKLQKEAEEKVIEVLDEEQKKKLDEIKKRLEPPAPPPLPERPRRE